MTTDVLGNVAVMSYLLKERGLQQKIIDLSLLCFYLDKSERLLTSCADEQQGKWLIMDVFRISKQHCQCSRTQDKAVQAVHYAGTHSRR